MNLVHIFYFLDSFPQEVEFDGRNSAYFWYPGLPLEKCLRDLIKLSHSAPRLLSSIQYVHCQVPTVHKAASVRARRNKIVCLKNLVGEFSHGSGGDTTFIFVPLSGVV